MRKLLYLSVLIFFVAVFSGCDRNDEPSVRRLVIEGWINTDKGPYAMVTMAYGSGAASNVADMMVRWAKVSVTDGTDTVVMTGGPDSDYFPPYIYSSYRMNGVPGRTYTIIAQYDGMTASATSRMLSPTPIDSVTVKPLADNDSLRRVTLHFTAPADCPAYYYLTLRKIKGHSASQPGLSLLSPTEVTKPGAPVSIDVLNTKNPIDSTSYVANMRAGDEFEINLCRVEKTVYDFWFGFNNYILFGNSQFISNQGSLTGNVTGGYGIFSAQATSSRYVKLD